MLVACYYCKKKDTDKKDMIQYKHTADSGNVYNRNYHKECFRLKEKQDEDNEGRDYLDSVIKEIHEIKQPHIPQQFWLRLQELRHGSIYTGRNRKKRYKEGFTYELIAETYLFCKETIKYHKKTKSFNSLTQELNYGYMIVCDKLSVVKKRQEKKKHQDSIRKEREKEQEKDIKTTESVKYNQNRKNRNDDISDFL